MKTLVIVWLACLGVVGCGGGPAGLKGPEAWKEFGVASESPPDADLPTTFEVPSFAPDRIWDGLIGLGFIGILWGLGFLVKRRVPNFKSYIFAAVGVAVVAVFMTRTSFYEFKSVTVDASGVTTTTQFGGERRVAFTDVRDVGVKPGAVFPVVTDARELVLLDANGQPAVSIPFFVPDRDRLGALLRRKLGLGPVP
jgi:hypothetical protein